MTFLSLKDSTSSLELFGGCWSFETKSCRIEVPQVHGKSYGNPLARFQSKRWKSHEPNNEARKQTKTTAQRLLQVKLRLRLKLPVRTWRRNEALSDSYSFSPLFPIWFDLISLDLSSAGRCTCNTDAIGVSTARPLSRLAWSRWLHNFNFLIFSLWVTSESHRSDIIRQTHFYIDFPSLFQQLNVLSD